MSRAITALFISIAFSTAVFATTVGYAVVPIEKQSEQTALYREIFDRLATRHYRGQVIDDDLSQRYLEHYIDQLDSTKSYFLQSDIEEFNQWQDRLDDLAKRGDVSPGFIMFNRLRERATARLKPISPFSKIQITNLITAWMRPLFSMAINGTGWPRLNRRMTSGASALRIR